MLHYTLNTGEKIDFQNRIILPSYLALLMPMAQHAITEGQCTASLPQSLARYSVNISAIEGAAMFDLLGVGLIETNIVAWSEAGASPWWQPFEKLYLQESGPYNQILNRALFCPDTVPWLATFVSPVNLEPIRTPWTTCFEQYLAIALIKAARP